MYQFEEVTNDEGIALAKELNSIYQRTSAKETSGGILKAQLIKGEMKAKMRLLMF